MTVWVPLAIAIVAAGFDLRSREIPDSLSVGALVGGLSAAAFGWTSVPLDSAASSVVVVFVVAMLFAWRGGFGGGDVKLLAGLAAWLPLAGGFALLFWTAILGAGLSIVAAVREKSSLAYGPAIAAGFAVAALLPGALPGLILAIQHLAGVSR